MEYFEGDDRFVTVRGLRELKPAIPEQVSADCSGMLFLFVVSCGKHAMHSVNGTVRRLEIL